MPVYEDATPGDVAKALEQSAGAFSRYKLLSCKDRSLFLYQMAEEIGKISTQLIAVASSETHLDKSRLEPELKRTIFQLTSYADAYAEGSWMELRIDTGEEARTPPKPDLRKMLVPLGPVVVFGASNFPFAYSTAGGDTACALAAGCTVVIKAHPAHAETSEMVAQAILKASEACGLPDGVFIHLHGAAFEVGKALVQHPLTKAVGFTGSFEGGKALFDLANQREIPIPVFAEMGSVNPVFILPQKLSEGQENLATTLAASITLSAGQFCTNPGIIVAVDREYLNNFKTLLSKKISEVKPVAMLHKGIGASFHLKRKAAIAEGVEVLTLPEDSVAEQESLPTLAQVTASLFIQKPLLHKEVFGPYSLLVICNDEFEMEAVARTLEGQLTATLWATDNEAKQHTTLIDILKERCGRLIFNGVPTGVEVALSMHHGGPFPATTDSRFTAVGADGIKRFARPICFQNWSNYMLPDELKNNNPLHLWRTVNNVLTKEPLSNH